MTGQVASGGPRAPAVRDPHGGFRRARGPRPPLTEEVDTAVKQPPATVGAPSAAAHRNLVMATIGFGLTFWAWNLIAPLSGGYKERLGLSSFEQSLLVAVPVLVGSPGRIPVGALTDKYGARLMFPLVSARSSRPSTRRWPRAARSLCSAWRRAWALRAAASSPWSRR